MGQTHPGEYGMVTQLSRQIQVSRQTLYTWRDHACQALVAAFTPALPPSTPLATTTARQILTLWITHAEDTSGITIACIPVASIRVRARYI